LKVISNGPLTVPEIVDGIEWTVAPRATVAIRSAMALYGIEGLTPVRTMLNADASKVRTVYVVNGAEVVLLQEKRPAPTNTANQGQAGTPPSEQTAERTVPTLGALQQRNAVSVWSSTRGEVVLTLRGADAAGLGGRVRPE
jgi:hypothetical protein